MSIKTKTGWFLTRLLDETAVLFYLEKGRILEDKPHYVLKDEEVLALGYNHPLETMIPINDKERMVLVLKGVRKDKF